MFASFLSSTFITLWLILLGFMCKTGLILQSEQRITHWFLKTQYYFVTKRGNLIFEMWSFEPISQQHSSTIFIYSPKEVPWALQNKRKGVLSARYTRLNIDTIVIINAKTLNANNVIINVGFVWKL